MNEKINLVELLKDCPKGTRLYSPLFGEVELENVLPNSGDTLHPIKILCEERIYSFTEKGLFDIRFPKGECLLFPSKDQRDWSKWECPKLKFDPKTLQPFDRVLFKTANNKWNCAIVSHVEALRIYLITGGYVYYCIPYNNDTIHLVGTTEEAPEYYRYWEE